MPEKVKAKLKRSGKKKGFVGKKLDKYVYGGLRKLGWKPKREKKSKSKYQRSK